MANATANGTGMSMSMEEMQALVARLTAENAAMKAATSGALPIKVSDKGAVSVYSLGRFPVTLYVEQWERLFDNIDHIKAFIAANRTALKTKVPAGEQG